MYVERLEKLRSFIYANKWKICCSASILILLLLNLPIYPNIGLPFGCYGNHNNWKHKIETIEGVKVTKDYVSFDGPFFKYGIITLEYRSEYKLELFNGISTRDDYPLETIDYITFGGLADYRIQIEDVNNLIPSKISSLQDVGQRQLKLPTNDN